MAASVESLLREISGVDQPVEQLQLLKTALFALPAGALRDSVSGQRFNAIFALLNSDRRSVFISHLFFPSLTIKRLRSAESERVNAYIKPPPVDI